jgi:hypothetical protein
MLRVRLSLRTGRATFSTKKDIFHQIQDRVASNVAIGMESLKGTMIQVMAQRMNEDDMVSMANHWGKKLSGLGIEQAPVPPMPSAEQSPSPQTIAPTTSRSHTTSSRTLEMLQEEAQSTAGDIDLYHPILGEQIADLGYKKVYLTSVKRLVLAPVWRKQRILRPERAVLIASDKIKNKRGSSLAGCIVMFQDKETKRVGIVDGQHRVGALMVLSQRGYWDEHAENVVVEVFPTGPEAEVTALFKEINSAEPVRLVDLLALESEDDESMDGSGAEPGAEEVEHPEPAEAPAPVGGTATGVRGSSLSSLSSQSADAAENMTATKKPKAKNQQKDLSAAAVRDILDKAADALQEKYPEMFKVSSRCRIPHIHVDVLRDDLFQCGFLSRNKVNTTEQLLQLLHEINARLAARYRAEYPGILGNAKKGAADGADGEVSNTMVVALRKAQLHNFYLGLDKGWHYQ